MALWLWLLLVLVVALIFYRHHKESITFPPGCPRYPIIGSLWYLHWSLLGCDFIIRSTQFASKYGKLMGYFIGPINRFVIVQDFDLAKEVVFNDVLTGRMNQPIVNEFRGINGRQVGILQTHGQIWKANRRFSLSTLRDFGFGKKSIGTVISDEVTAAVEAFKSKSGQDVLIHLNFYIPIFNIMWSMLAAKRFQPDDSQIGGFIKIMAEYNKYAFIYITFPWFRYISPERIRIAKQHYNTLKDMFRTIIDDHKNALISDSKPKDFIEAYLLGMKTNDDLTMEDLIGICVDFFEAGTETVANTLSWAMLYLAKFPDVQEKCYLELQSTGGGKSPTLDDRPGLPYCEATIMEIQRLACVLTTGLGHRALKSTTLGGYHIPEDALIYYNIWKFHHDPEYFPEPSMFKPERFLTPDGSSIMHNEHFIPFGFGKHMCMGVPLAKAELFLFFTSIVQMLKVSIPKKHKAPSEDEYEAGITRSPLPFHVHIMTRHPGVDTHA